MLRTDRGTENYTLAMIQPLLHHDHTDTFAEVNSHTYGEINS